MCYCILDKLFRVLNQHSTTSHAETLLIIHFRNSNIERHRIAWYILMVEDETVNRRFQITQNFCEFIISFLKGLDPFVLNFSPHVLDAGFPQVKRNWNIAIII